MGDISDRDLFIAASNAHVLAFDNVSGLPGFVSDTLCRLATGAGFAVRQLYTDQDETLFTAARPVILHSSAANCWQPYVKNFRPHDNSQYNNLRFEDVWLDK